MGTTVSVRGECTNGKIQNYEGVLLNMHVLGDHRLHPVLRLKSRYFSVSVLLKN
jgi:hypothetical protein